MKKLIKSMAAMILAAAALIAAAFVCIGTEADAVQSKPLQAGQYYQLGTSTKTVLNNQQQIIPRDNVFGDKFDYHGEYYYNGSDHPNTAAMFIDPDISDYGKYYQSGIRFFFK